MKKLIYISLIILLSSGFHGGLNASPLNHYGGYASFYHELSPYGRWIELAPDVIVWRPNIGIRWSPYTSGRWIWSNYGWYWDSYEPFGYVVFHYGRWFYDDYYGWIWLPDTQWGPAWVEWRYDDFYIGWSPLPPYAMFSINVGFYYSHNYVIPYNHWNFVKFKHFSHRHVNNYFIGNSVKYRTYNQTKPRTNYEIRNNSVFNRGVEPSDFERVTRTKLQENSVVFRDRSGNSDPIVRRENTIEINYRPDLTREVKERNIEKNNRKTSLDVEKIRERQNNDKDVVNRDQNVQNRTQEMNTERKIKVPEQERQSREKNDNIREQNNLTKEIERKEQDKEIRQREQNTQPRIDSQIRDVKVQPKNEIRPKQENNNSTIERRQNNNTIQPEIRNRENNTQERKNSSTRTTETTTRRR